MPFTTWWNLFWLCHRVDGLGALQQWCTLDGEAQLRQPYPVIQLFNLVAQVTREWLSKASKGGSGG